jgi:hypothetical protein
MNTLLEQHQLHNFSTANHPLGDDHSEHPANIDHNEVEMVIPPLTIEMTRDDYNTIQSFKPFIENATPQQKVDFLQKTIFKPKKRILKLLKKRNELKSLRLKDKEFLQQKIQNTQKTGRSFRGTAATEAT